MLTKRHTSEMYGSLMRLDDLDMSSSTTDLVSALVPANPRPLEQKLTVSNYNLQNIGVSKAISTVNLSNESQGLLTGSKHR